MIEVIRIVLMIIMLSMASYHDVRTRQIPDYIWIVFGSIGGILYVFDWNTIDWFVIFAMGAGFLCAVLAWKLFPMGEADVLAIITISVLCPVSFGVMNPIVVFFGGLVLEHVAAFFYNVWYNIQDTMYGKRIFSGVENSIFGKIMAFYSVHLRRSHEKYTFCAESICDGKRKINLKTPSAKSEYESRTGVFVTWAMPAFPFMLIAGIIGIIISSIIA